MANHVESLNASLHADSAYRRKTNTDAKKIRLAKNLRRMLVVHNLFASIYHSASACRGFGLLKEVFHGGEY